MRSFILLFVLTGVSSLCAMQKTLVRGMRRVAGIKQHSIQASCAVQLNAMLKEVDAQNYFNKFAHAYLAQDSKGNRFSRDISVFRALPVRDGERVRDLFDTHLKQLAGLWLAKQKAVSACTNIRESFHTYLIQELFSSYALPFEIGHPRMVGNALQPIWYLNKPIHGIYSDVTYPGLIAFQQKQDAVGKRILACSEQKTLLATQIEYLDGQRHYVSQEAENSRIQLTADRIAEYPSVLHAVGMRIDEEKENLMH